MKHITVSIHVAAYDMIKFSSSNTVAGVLVVGWNNYLHRRRCTIRATDRI